MRKNIELPQKNGGKSIYHFNFTSIAQGHKSQTFSLFNSIKTVATAIIFTGTTTLSLILKTLYAGLRIFIIRLRYNNTYET